MLKQLIQGRTLCVDTWTYFKPSGDDYATITVPPVTESGSVVVPAEFWLIRRDELLSRKAQGEAITVSLAPTLELERILDDLPHFEMIAVEFPKFTDGRGYSTARLLRERFGYKGELRAIGDVGRDQLFLLHRVGFDAYLLPENRDAAAALASFNDFPDAYQTGTDQPLPLFRRRAA